jgi:hypothetical protein
LLGLWSVTFHSSRGIVSFGIHSFLRPRAAQSLGHFRVVEPSVSGNSTICLFFTHGKDSCRIVTLHYVWKASGSQFYDNGVD